VFVVVVVVVVVAAAAAAVCYRLSPENFGYTIIVII
jgi:hypothetical protein